MCSNMCFEPQTSFPNVVPLCKVKVVFITWNQVETAFFHDIRDPFRKWWSFLLWEKFWGSKNGLWNFGGLVNDFVIYWDLFHQSGTWDRFFGISLQWWELGSYCTHPNVDNSGVGIIGKKVPPEKNGIICSIQKENHLANHLELQSSFKPRSSI